MTNRVKQQGAALLIAMVMLLIVTIIALSSVQSGIVQERISANLRDHQLAFQAAEAALRVGERARAGDPGFIGLPVGQVPAPLVDVQALFLSGLWGNANDVPLTGVSRPPRYITEELAFDGDGQTSMIRVTAFGFGARDETSVVLQSIVRI